MTQSTLSALDEAKSRKVELVLQQLDSLPTLPVIALRLMSLTGSPDARIEEVAQLLSADPSLSAKLLSLVNSAAVGVRTPITSVRQAVVMLGFESVRNLVLSVKVFEIFQHPGAEPGDEAISGPAVDLFDRTAFWKHSLAVATAAEMLASRAKPRLNVHDAFVCGLLHDLGKVALDTAMPKSYARVMEVALMTRGDVADIERRIIGMDHGLAGKRLAEAWNLPQVITQAIWLHGAPPPAPGGFSSAGVMSGASGGGAGGGASRPGGMLNLRIVLAVGLADLLVRRQHIGFSGNFLFPYEALEYAGHLGLSAPDIAEVTAGLAEAVESRARSIGLYDVESRQLYLESIANANAELGRVNQQLGLQNRKLATRSNCFEMMTRFYQRIGPAASPGQLLAEIGQAAHGFLESPRLVLFSQDPEAGGNSRGGAGPGAHGAAAGMGEVLTFDAARDVQDSFIMAMPAYGGDHRMGSGRAGQNFTRPASPQFDWLLERVQAFLGTSRCWVMPLLCGNEPVGGVVWVASDVNAGNSMAEVTDLALVSQSWGMTLRTAQIREQQTLLTESLAAANRELGTLQQQLVRAKSLSNLGEMAAGAAHEMNNPLAVVCGRAQLLAASLTDPKMKENAGLIAQQGQRLSQIITDMMEFAKPQAPRIAPFDAKRMVEEAVRAAQQRAGSPGAGAGGAGGSPAPGGGETAVKLEVGPGIPEARGDSQQIQSALVEVIVNAIQATRAAEATGKGVQGAAAGRSVLVQARFDPLDSQLIVQVTDRGIGMTEDVLRQAFSPFYSAKSAGRNRGLGLAKALRWIENHGGTIRLDSHVSATGAGTTAVVIVPLAGPARATALAPSADLRGHAGE